MAPRGLRSAWPAVGLTLLLASINAAAEERIKQFSSHVVIRADATAEVTETISVVSEGREIRRGIYRDFPITYRDRLGNRVRVTFDVVSVERDGNPEPYAIESLLNGIRIRIGAADRLLDSGLHEYRLTYRSQRQLGFFDTFDELYWNVTGTGWGFPIDSAIATVVLPPGARPLRQIAYTGAEGSTGDDYRYANEGDRLVWRTTRTLRPREGLTIAVAWPKGHVAAPTLAERAGYFVKDNLATGVALGGTTLVLIYYLLAWRRFGQDPPRGSVFPRFKPPEGLSPAAARFVWMMGFDRLAFAAALISMATKGYLTINDDNGYRLERQADAELDNLAGGERRIAKRLLMTRSSLTLTNKEHALLRKTIATLRESLESEYERLYFERNGGLFILGLFLSIAIVAATSLAGQGPATAFAAIGTLSVAATLTFLVARYWLARTDPVFRASLLNRGGRTAVRLILPFLFVASAGTVMGVIAQAAGQPLQSLCFALIGALNVLFFFLLKKPTLAGREIMDEIEGFRMYLGTAEEERLNRLNPPDKTPELFERYLPYALALGLENEWSEKFATTLAVASADPERAGSYRPRWYRGSRWQPGRASAFSGGLGAGLSSAVASSSTPPGSSSGSGGGGFSGGGGGGGGGGGW